MPKLVVVTAEGVLCRRDGDNTFRANQPIGPGLDLLACLSQMYNVCVASDETDRKVVHTWLIEHGLREHFSYVIERGPLMHEDPAERFMDQLTLLRSQGFSIGMAVVADPVMAASALHKGFTSMLFSHPAYARPEWRPDDDRGLRSWADIEEDLARQAELKATDARVGANSGRFEDA